MMESNLPSLARVKQCHPSRSNEVPDLGTPVLGWFDCTLTPRSSGHPPRVAVSQWGTEGRTYRHPGTLGIWGAVGTVRKPAAKGGKSQ